MNMGIIHAAYGQLVSCFGNNRVLMPFLRCRCLCGSLGIYSICRHAKMVISLSRGPRAGLDEPRYSDMGVQIQATRT